MDCQTANLAKIFWINQLIFGAVGVSLAIPANYNSDTCQNVPVFCAFMGIAAIGTFQEMVCTI